MKTIAFLILFLTTALAQAAPPVVWGVSGGNSAAQVLASQICFSDTTCQSTAATGSGSAILLPNGLVGTPALRFTNDTSSGLYRVGAGEIGFSIVGVEALDFVKSGGGFGNIGLGGSASASDNFPLLAQRGVAGALNMQASQTTTGAGQGAKWQAVAGAGAQVMEMSVWDPATSAPAAYGNGTIGNGVLRANSSNANMGMSLVVDTGSGSFLYHYVGGNAAANLVLTEKPNDFIYNNVHTTSNFTTAPTTTVKTSLGSTGTCTIAHGTDVAGQVTLTPGGSGISTGAQCQINFNVSYSVAPICIFYPTLPAILTDGVKDYVQASAVGSVTLGFNAAPTTGHVYTYNYQCIETQ